MKIKILKPIKVAQLGKKVLPASDEVTYEVDDNVGKILVKREYAEEVKGDDKPKGANEVIELIKAVEKVEDLKPFESDTRATVKKAYDEKLEELSKDK